MCVSIYTTLASKNSLHKVLIEWHAALQNADADIILCVWQRVKAKELVKCRRLPAASFPCKSSLHAFRDGVSHFPLFVVAAV